MPSPPSWLLPLSLMLCGAGAALSASAEPIDPKKDIPACILWLDAAACTAGKDTHAVTVWPDRSGLGHDAAVPDDGSKPELQPAAIGGLPALRFAGDDCLEVSIIRDWSRLDWTLFAVASLEKDTPDNYRGIVGNRFGPGRAHWWTLGTKSDGTNYLELAAGKGVHTGVHPAGTGAAVYTVTKRGATFALYRDGIRLGTAEMANAGGEDNALRLGRWLGKEQGWQGAIGEVLLYGMALDNGQRRAVEEYLADKWTVPIVPDPYVKKPGWAETMTASRAAFTRARKDLFGRFPEDTAKKAESLALELLWQRLRDDFPAETALFMVESADGARLAWFRNASDTAFERSVIEQSGPSLQDELAALVDAAAPPCDPRWLGLFLDAARTRQRFRELKTRLEQVNLEALRRGVAYLGKTYPERYPEAAGFLREIAQWRGVYAEIGAKLDSYEEVDTDLLDQMLAFQRRVGLANPLLDFDQLLLVRRSLASKSLGLPQNWQSNCYLPRRGFENGIAVLSPPEPNGTLTSLYEPDEAFFVGDVDLHFDADRLLFSSIGSHDRWQIFEIRADGTGLRQVTPGTEPDVDNYDACYLPDDGIIFCSSAYFAAVPCVNGSTRTANLYRMRPDGTGIRQLCFDQEHNWCPTMLPDGRVLYLRWEYTDTPHSHDRVLFHMNPDGTGQMEYYGSNSYWPNSLFYARPVPDRPAQFIGVVGGHHGVPRMGELVLFDAAKGRREAAGAVQRIPGYGIPVASETSPKYRSTLIQDRLVDASWPKYLHPYPLDAKHFLVACKPSPDALWGIYLADVFDNRLLLREEPGYALFEPVPLRKTERPPVIPDRIQPDKDYATVYMTDVYAGGGLEGVPRGTVKQLRLITYHFLYPGMGGPQAVVGMEGPWDIKRVLGTVPVERDGSALFRVPKNTPIAVQPLDEEGKALQLMRSWFTGMPGEVLSCVGCHESQSSVPPPARTMAAQRPPSNITRWYGPERGFNYDREVQPVLDKHCAGCHDGTSDAMDLKTRGHITDYKSVFHSGGKDAGHFSVSYANLHRFVRRPGLESDYHMLMPLEYHADTTQLVQLLEKGHGNVALDPESWDRIITWIDLNAPFHGTWTEIAGEERVKNPAERRHVLLKRYADTDSDPEAVWRPEKPPLADVESEPRFTSGPDTRVPDCPGWPFDAQEARRRQREAAGPVLASLSGQAAESTRRTVSFGDGMELDLVLIPSGEFVMGDAQGMRDELPLTRVRIPEPFWMGRFEITNEQFEAFDPSHDSRVESRFSMQFGVRGFYVNEPHKPAVRVSWEEAMAFCRWLSEQTGERFTLPAESQWEYACRAGTDTAFYYGGTGTDFGAYANLADQTLREFVCHTYKKEREPWFHASKYDDWIPKDLRVNDNGFLSDGTGRYEPNAWGLHDMHGNVWEWTRSVYRPYPYRDDDGRNADDAEGRRVVRGGSWRDRPHRARSAFRLAYRPYQGVYNVGFRVVCRATQWHNAGKIPASR